MKRAVSLFMLTLLIFSSILLTIRIKPVKTEPASIIVPDDYATIQEAINAANNGDSVFVRNGTYNENIVVNKSVSLIGESQEATFIDGGGVGNAVFITSNNVTITGFKIQGSGRNPDDSAVLLENAEYCNISDNIVAFNTKGIYLRLSSNNTILRNNLFSNNVNSIEIESSDFNRIEENNMTESGWFGCFLENATNNMVLNNRISESFRQGLVMAWCFNNTLRGNILENNLYNLGIFGAGILREFLHMIDDSNSVDGKPVHYFVNQTDLMINPSTYPEVGLLALINCRNITVEELTLMNNGYGLLLVSTNNSVIINNNITNNLAGCRLRVNCMNNVVDGNRIFNNEATGLGVGYHSNNNTLRYNFVSDNRGFSASVPGLTFSPGSSNNTAYGNVISHNPVGVLLENASANLIYHNSFINNTIQLMDVYSQPQLWNESYPIGGNYWSHYTGIDLYSGYFQNETGSDGIGDTPYVLNENNTDYYPLMGPWTETGENTTTIHGSGVSLTFDNVTSSGITTINETLAGPDPPTGFKLVLEPPMYYDIDTTANYSGPITISIPYDDSGMSENEKANLKLLHWNETQQQWVNITTFVDTANNIIYGETSSLSLFGFVGPFLWDVTGDNYVGIDDIVAVAEHFGQDSGHPDWDSKYDITGDDYVGIDDIVEVAEHFGESI